MAKRQEIYKPRTFESDVSMLPKNINGKHNKDTSANIYLSMLQSKAWHNLTYKQKELYIYCKAQQFGEKKSPKEHLTEYEATNGINADLSKRFTMNKSKWCEIYGLYTENTQRHFYKDMQALIQNGFINVLEKGKLTRTKNIYEYSDRWREQGEWQKQ